VLRAFVLVVAIALFLAGVLTVVGAAGDPDLLGSGIWFAFIFGAVAVLIVLERQRYRSASAERAGLQPGPGGGEDADRPLEPRFTATAEVFIDPSSGRRMRVWVDRVTGERCYRAEG